MCASCGPIENSARGSASVESRETTYALSGTLASSAGRAHATTPVFPRRHPLTLGAFAQDTGYAPPRERRHALNGDVGATFAHVAITPRTATMAPTEPLATWSEGRVFPFTREKRRVLEEQKATFKMRPKSADLRSPIGYDIARFGLPADAPVTSGYQAGREGFGSIGTWRPM